MSCAPMRFLVGAGLTAALAGLGYMMTDGYAAAAIDAEGVEAGAAETTVTDIETSPAAVPETPATAETVANCQAEVDTTIKGKTIQFDSGTATIKVESQPLIDAMATVLTPCAGTQIEVAGHTDLTGDAGANMRLSEARANAVVAALVAKGVPNARLTPKGYGETQPAMPGMRPAANAANRRIEFAVAIAAPAAVDTTTAPAPGQ